MAAPKIAIQLYSLRDEAKEDLRGILLKLAEMGYDGVEFAGLYGHSPEKVRDFVKEAGLFPLSAHIPFVELTRDTEAVIDTYITIGCPYIAVPYLSEEFHPGGSRFGEAIDAIRTIGEACRRKSVVLLYHNHDFEFKRMADGRYGLDYLYESIGPELLQSQIDVCWVRVAGLDPAKYIRRYKGRCPIVHLKDYVGGKSENMYNLIGLEEKSAAPEQKFAFRAVGHGVQDIPSITAAATDCGASWFVVEQDSHSEHTALEDARLSIDYLKTIAPFK